MDPLTILGAVTGGISAASETFKVLDKAITITSKVKDAPELAISTLRDVRMMRQNMVRFQMLLDSESLVRERGLYIPLDDAQNTFMDCVTSLDELESLLKPLSDPSLQNLAMSQRLEWAMKDNRIAQLSKRVHDAQSSLGLMLTILQHESLIEIRKAVVGLADICQRIAPNVAHLNRRSISAYTRCQFNTDEEDDSSTIRPPAVLRPDSIIVPETGQHGSQHEPTSTFTARFVFEEALEASRAYRRTPKLGREDVSFRSSVINTQALSLFSQLSNLSLGEVSIISVIALPLFCNDISNLQHYTFGETEAGDALAQRTNSPIENDVDKAFSEYRRESILQPSSPTPRSGSPLSPRSTPQSPSIPGKAGVTRMLKAMRRAFEPEIAGIVDGQTDDAVSRSPSSPNQTTIPGSFDLDPRIAHLFNAQNKVLSLRQLSTLHLEHNEWRLCHSIGSAPCYGAVKTWVDEGYSVDKIRFWQLNLAAANGFLNTFRCQKCHFSLEKIVQKRRPDRYLFEIWCGSKTCLGTHPKLRPCSCYTKMQQLGLPTEKYFGCRQIPFNDVKCARCFRICPLCAAKSTTVTKDTRFAPRALDTIASTGESQASRCWDIETDSGKIYAIQEILLRTQRYIIDHINLIPSASEATFNYKISALNLQLKELIRLGDASNDSFVALEERQRVLDMRKSMIPSWRQMSDLVMEGSSFWRVALENMRERINESQNILNKLEKTNVLSVIDWPYFISSLEEDWKLKRLFAGLGEGFDIEAICAKAGLPQIVIGIAM